MRGRAINPVTIKVGTRVSAEENRRLEEIAIKSGFKTTYSLLRYLVFVFLRAASGDDCVDRTLPIDIVKLFLNSYEGDKEWMLRHIEKVKQQEQWRSRQQKHRAHKEEQRDIIHDEIQDLFSECEETGMEMSWSPDINKRM